MGDERPTPDEFMDRARQHARLIDWVMKMIAKALAMYGPSVADKHAPSHPAWRAFCRWYRRLSEAERLQTRASILWEAFKAGLHAKRSTTKTRV